MMYFVDYNRPYRPSLNFRNFFGRPTTFSEYELLLCYGKGDCKHRSTQYALEYGYSHGFVPINNYFPKMPCPGPTPYKFQTLYAIKPDEKSIMSYIVNRGPVILHLYLPVQLLKNYIGSGVIGPFPECKDKVSNHAMVAVGFGEQFGMKYWLLKNSWGIDWGDYGYIRWRRGINACNIEANPVGGSFVVHPWQDQF
ncbi:unnamed protein product [Enterobius vermicularis]|uniref:Pept_C1 domain-containing protein n=1 Tax=Enterobius vermicularis TaxID=51028 RepID=A0A0N4VNE7_ENTVE|nr:unnamed protein product [Enterobius vermicularis]